MSDRDEPPRSRTDRLQDFHAAFPEAKEAAQEMARRPSPAPAGEDSVDAASSGDDASEVTSGDAPVEDVDLDADGAAEPDDAEKPSKLRPKSAWHNRRGEGLRGSDEFIKTRPKGTAPLHGETAPLEAPEDVDAGDEAAVARAARLQAALETRWQKLWAAAEDALRIATVVLDPLEAKVGAVRIAVDLAQRAPNDRDMRIALLPKEIHQLMHAMIGRIHADPAIGRRLHVAVFQFGDAKRAIAALKERMERAAELPRAEGLEFLAKIELPKVRGKLYVVSNFRHVFRGDPVISRLFPLKATGPMPGPEAPAKAATDPKLEATGRAATGPGGAPAPTAPSGPLAPLIEAMAEAAPPAPAPAPAAKSGTANLKDAWDAVRNKLGKKKPG